MRPLSFAAAIREATEQCMEKDASVYVMGLGVPDPGAIFGTTASLKERFGAERVMDMPVAENGMTGIAIGSALAGMRPIVTHQRVDFMLLSMEQIVNQAAKWHYTFNGAKSVPMVIRVIIGRGWGQGPQHMQSLYSWFAHIPGLKVVMPFSPADAKGLLVAAIEDDNPVVFMEHRWLHRLVDDVPQHCYATPLGKARIVCPGKDVSIVAVSHMTYEALQAAALLEQCDVSAEVVDVRTLRPLDTVTIFESVKRTGRLVTAEPGWGMCGFGAELIAQAVEAAFGFLTAPPVRISLPEYPLPVSPGLSESYYPRAVDIATSVMNMLHLSVPKAWHCMSSDVPHDVPDLNFAGPF